MSGYTKLFSDIVMSTIWREASEVKVLWITMLAIKDRDHNVLGSLPGLADAARITIEQCEEALKILMAPDPYSRSKEFEGRRVEEIEGGWTILNGEKYRHKMSKDDQREKQRIRQQRYRDRQKARATKEDDEALRNVTERNELRSLLHTDTDTDKKNNTRKNDTDLSAKNSVDWGVRYTEVLEKWNTLAVKISRPRVVKRTDVRRGWIRKRYDDIMPEWEALEKAIRNSDLLCGRTSSQWPGVTFDWIWQSPHNYVKILEGNYANTRTQKGEPTRTPYRHAG